jgi:shikimate dehydrogenase
MIATAASQPKVTGATRLFGIVGDPIWQVKSPEIFNPQIAATGRNAVLIPIHLRASDFELAIDKVMQIANLDGLVVTMPFKERMAARLASISDRARSVGAVNAVRRSASGEWVGDMFDGVGFLGAVRSIGLEPRGLRAGLVGAGGAGSAIAFALAESGVGSLTIYDRDGCRAETLSRRIAEAYALSPSTKPFRPADVDLLINATPVGMNADDGTPIDVEGLTSSTSVVDIVTKAGMTSLLSAAAVAGSRYAGGAAMVASQTAAILDFFGLTAASA